MPVPSAEKIEKARKAAEQAKARLQALEARVSQETRKLDTRRKIILGGLLIEAATQDEKYCRVVTALLHRMSRSQDKKAFEDWTIPAAPPPSSLGVPETIPGTPATAIQGG